MNNIQIEVCRPKHRLGQRKYKLLEAVLVPINDITSISIPKGFEWDGASSPLFREAFLLASLPHDAAYDGLTTLTRKEADQLFFRLLREDKVPRWLSYIAYFSVRLFGRAHWHAK